ncbi:hypothetical protein XENTR_v10012602 [Xenopus tropicalis]|nr:hypothetical protein XENTR_v10012602 [Xenopus tropicalis]
MNEIHCSRMLSISRSVQFVICDTCHRALILLYCIHRHLVCISLCALNIFTEYYGLNGGEYGWILLFLWVFKHLFVFALIGLIKGWIT